MDVKAAATVTELARKYGAEITVFVIDEKQKEALPQHETQMASIRWHLYEGGFKLLERLGEGHKPTAIIGEVADDLNLDLVVISMEAIHSKHVDANLLAGSVPALSYSYHCKEENIRLSIAIFLQSPDVLFGFILSASLALCLLAGRCPKPRKRFHRMTFTLIVITLQSVAFVVISLHL